MRLSQCFLAAFSLGALSECAAGISLFRSSLARDVQQAALMGLDPDLILNDPAAFRSAVANAADTSLPAQWTTIPIDHNDSSVGTYRNRYWVNSDYYKPGQPVFVYDVGEANAQPSANYYLANKTSFFKHILAEFDGLGIVWEHRYYGKSLPFPVNSSTPPQHFQYLTDEQALADIPYFARNFSRSKFPHVDLTPKATPWVMIGGSYSGIRAASTRELYSDTIYAAFASSAPVEARINMTVYFSQVYRGMNAYGFGNCTKDVHAALSYIDSQLASNKTASAIKKLFLGPGAEENSNGDFTSALGGIFLYFQNYGMGGGNGSLEHFCNYMETIPHAKGAKKVAGAEGLAPVYGAKYVAEKWASWPTFVKLINLNYNTTCRLNATSPVTCDVNPVSKKPDDISWDWQYCSQFGYFQAANAGPHSLLSSYQTLEYQQEVCYRQFPTGLSSGFLPKKPQVQVIDDWTKGWYMRPSNVYWSGGEFDPWRTLSTLSSEPFAPHGVNFTTEIPACGVSTGEKTLFGYIMSDAEHCFDFKHDFAQGAVSRGYFIKALKHWLGCFNGTISAVGREEK